jgi:uncharacterized membrane-anchored protein
MRRILALAAFQVLAILSWASYHEYVWATASTFRIPLRPRDPFDLIRGRYFVLNPEDTSIDAQSAYLPVDEVKRFLGSSTAFAGTVQVGLCPANEVYRVCALAHPKERAVASARFWCKGFATITKQETGWKVHLDLGLRRFFIPNRLQLPAGENQEGWELEVSHRPGLSPLPRRLFFKGTPIDLR